MEQMNFNSLNLSLIMAKAFDRVWHCSLLSKLSTFGLLPKLFNWVTAFLRQRRLILGGKQVDVSPDGK